MTALDGSESRDAQDQRRTGRIPSARAVMADLRDRVDRSLVVARAPRVSIAVYGGGEAKDMYRSFTAPHPRFRFTSSKKWGVALVRLPDSIEEYLAGGSMEFARRQRRRAERAGYRYAQMPPLDHLDEILEINRSMPVRQGRPMLTSYVDARLVALRFKDRAAIHGVLDNQGRLRAYSDAPAIGDVFLFRAILGAGDHLDKGIMYLLATEVIRTYIEIRRVEGSPSWAMYDTIWGASKGLAFFKEHLGFQPYTVDWRWIEDAIDPRPNGSDPQAG
jgi:hypothetical protein